MLGPGYDPEIDGNGNPNGIEAQTLQQRSDGRLCWDLLRLSIDGDGLHGGFIDAFLEVQTVRSPCRS